MRRGGEGLLKPVEYVPGGQWAQEPAPGAPASRVLSPEGDSEAKGLLK